MKLLASLSSREYRRIAPRLHPITLSNGSLLPQCGRSRVYFPGSGVCSILSRMNDGTTITLTCRAAEGIAAGKTFVKYKDVTVGTVTAA